MRCSKTKNKAEQQCGPATTHFKLYFWQQLWHWLQLIHFWLKLVYTQWESTFVQFVPCSTCSKAYTSAQTPLIHFYHQASAFFHSQLILIPSTVPFLKEEQGWHLMLFWKLALCQRCPRVPWAVVSPQHHQQSKSVRSHPTSAKDNFTDSHIEHQKGPILSYGLKSCKTPAVKGIILPHYINSALLTALSPGWNAE